MATKISSHFLIFVMEKKELIRDFIDLNKISLQAIKNLGYIEYAFGQYGILDEWNQFTKYIEERFGSKEEYKKYYNETKEKFLKYVKGLQEFQTFNTQDMSRFRFDFPEDVCKGNQYTESNIGKTLLSIDLKKANFQALKYCGVFEEETYSDLISKFTDIPFLRTSKYLRSVVFGQLNPGRHITVESWLVNSLRPEIPDTLRLVCMASDELVYEVPEDVIILKSDLDGTKQEIYEKYGLEISTEYYKLNVLILESSISKKQYKIYSKESLCGDGNVYKCIPNNLWLIFNKLLKNESVEDYDTWIEHDGVLSKYIESFTLK